MEISGILIHFQPDKVSAVQEQISEFPGLDIHLTTEDGKMVVTLVGETEKELAQVSDRFLDVPGILSAAMVYHQSEPELNLSR